MPHWPSSTSKRRADTSKGQAAADFKTNRYDEQTDTLVFTTPQRLAFEQLQTYYGGYFGDATTRNGPPIISPRAFFLRRSSPVASPSASTGSRMRCLARWRLS
jgi:hypothetical protein